jgi:predicted ribosomally synthesized peptide with SipW-like signal peptide
MKSRMLISMLVIALAAAAIGGATMAWFTAEADVPDVTFTAGTVDVEVDNNPAIATLEDRSIENVNPGDCATICWNIRNVGTKRAELRVKVDSGWVGEVEEAEQVVFFAPKPDSGWVMYEDEEGLWLYYINGPVAPVAGDDEGVKLCLVVGFDGPDMDNRYQELDYSIGGTVYAVQATNGAPEDLWGEAWTNVKNGEGLYVEDYFVNGNGASMPCWNGGTTDPDPEPTPPELDRFEVSELEVGPKDYWSNVPVTATITAYDTEDNVFDFNGSKNVNIVVKAKLGSSTNDFSKTVTVTFNNGVADLNTSVYIDGYSLLDSGHTVTVVVD